MTAGAIAQVELPTSSPGGAARLRLQYLDGIRGLACLWVVFMHAWNLVPWEQASGALRIVYRATLWADLGRAAVAIFIVLSGYCLMLPVAQSPDGRLRGGVKEYFKRRAWRILPPYYAAVAVGVILPWAVGREFFAAHAGRWWKSMQPAAAPGVLLSHLALVHNLNANWIYKINSAMWTVATEWQIYFVFALILLPVWRKFGDAAALALAMGIGIALALGPRLRLASPWFVGLFGMGMVSASLAFARSRWTVGLRKYVPWGGVAAAGFAALMVAGEFPALRANVPGFYFLADMIAGTAAAALMIYCTAYLLRMKSGQRLPAVLRLLEARPAVVLGTFSYSLYLIHPIVLTLFEMIGKQLRPSPVAGILLYLLAAMGASVAIAYFYYLGFERPFVRPRNSAAMRAAY